MLAVWGYIEADFQRDYGLNLAVSLPHMSWRRFKILLHGLSPWGAVAIHYDEAIKAQIADEERRTGQPSENANRFWGMIASL